MRLVPAIDLRQGACVQLVGGSYADERIRIPDPLAVARRWAERGFRWLHVVDLDAATGCGENRDVIAALLAARVDLGAELQVGGGVRSRAAIGWLLERGAARVVVGTRALADPAWLAKAAAEFPGRLVLAADVRGGRLATHGWRLTREEDPCATVRALTSLPLAAVLVTAIDGEGAQAGADLPLLRAMVAASRVPVIAAGGVGSLADVRAIATTGVEAVVVGMALYTGALDSERAVAEFAS